MELRQLRYFVAIADHAGFRPAAEHLRLAQPALSQQMRRLEDELGVALFDRSTRPVQLTDAGAHLLPQARDLLRDAERAAAEVRDFATAHRGRLAVGAMQYLTNLELPDLLAAFSREHPLVEVGLRVGNSGQLSDALEAGEVDIAICHADELGRRPGLATEPLRTEELVFVVGAADDRAERDTVTIAELDGAPLITFRRGASIREALVDAFRAEGLEARIAFESADLPTAVGLVARGLGIALVPRSIAAREPTVTALRVAPNPLLRHVALVWRRDRHRSRVLEAFRSAARDALAVPDLRP